MSGLDEAEARPGEWVQVGAHQVRVNPPPLMRPQPPEVWSHLVTFVNERLLERRAHPADLWRALERFADLLIISHEPRPSGPGESDVDVEDALWHLASIWRRHPAFRPVLEREHARRFFGWTGTPRSVPDRDEWIRRWTP